VALEWKDDSAYLPAGTPQQPERHVIPAVWRNRLRLAAIAAIVLVGVGGIIISMNAQHAKRPKGYHNAQVLEGAITGYFQGRLADRNDWAYSPGSSVAAVKCIRHPDGYSPEFDCIATTTNKNVKLVAGVEVSADGSSYRIVS
jgi:hypothetical protein